MSFSGLSRSVLLTSLIFFAMAGPLALARNGRDFAGFYDLQAVADKGDEVQATLVLRLYNYSGSDLRQAVVLVHELPPGNRDLAAFAPIPVWQDGTELVIHRQVNIPRGEYQQWTSHSQPEIIIVNRDENGEQRQRRAQVSAHPIPLPDDALAQ